MEDRLNAARESFEDNLRSILADQVHAAVTDTFDTIRAGLNKSVQPVAVKRERRSPERVEGVKKAIVSSLKSEKGQTCEELSENLGLPTSEIKGPLSQLLQSKVLRRKGATRSTRYSLK